MNPPRILVNVISYALGDGHCSLPKKYFVLCLQFDVSVRCRYRPEFL